MAKGKKKPNLANDVKKEPLEKTVEMLQETVKMLLDKVDMLEGTVEECRLKIKARDKQSSVKIDDAEKHSKGLPVCCCKMYEL